MKKKALLSSILTIALCLSLIAGSTFALFTSESKVNVAVTSGKVDVVATMDGLTLYSPTSIDQSGNIVDAANAATATTFANGGAAVATDNTITLTNITPGDKVTFNIHVKNNSNVTIKYRTILACEGDTGLFAGLKVLIDGEEYIGQTRVTAYETLAAGDGDYTIPVVIELPTTADNIYQDKTMKLSYTVQAVQGNTETYDPENDTYYIYSANDLALLKYFAPSVKNVLLMNDVDMTGVEYEAWDLAIPASTTFTFDGQGYAIKNLTTSGYTGALTANDFQRSGLFAAVTSANHAQLGKIVIKNLTMDNATVMQMTGEEAAAAALIGFANVVNVEIDGCKVVNSHITSAKYAAGLVAYAQEYYDTVSVTVKNAIIANNEIVGNGHTAGLVGLANRTVTVEASEIENNIISGKLGHSAAAIVGTGSVAATGIVATGNTYAGGLKDCENDTKDDIYGIYHKQCGDYTIDETSTGADNTIVEAYIILSLNDFKDFRDTVNEGYSFLQYTVGKTAETVPHNVLLYTDLDLGNEEWTPIGTFENPFMGDFDGQNHTIRNLKITSGTNVGLFGQITMKGQVNYLPGIFNLTLNNVTIQADGSGAFVGNSYATTQNAGNGGCLVLSNLKLTGNVKIEGKDVGGILGTEWADFQIIGTNITVDVNAGSYVKGTGTIGGVFASAPHAHLNYIQSNINVIASGADVTAGGIVGCAGWDIGCDSDAADDGVGSIICTGNVVATGVEATADGKYTIGKIVGKEANNPYWAYYNWAEYGSFFKNFTANNTISITLTDGTVLTSNGMTADDRHGAANEVDYTQSLVGPAIWRWNLQERSAD